MTAALWMTGAVVSFSTMAIAGRELSSELNTFQIMFWRSLIGAATLALLIGVSRRGFAQLRTQRPGLHLLRNVGHYFGQNCWLYAVTVIPLAQVFALEFTVPIWVALLAPFILGERFTVMKLVSVLLGFFGVLLVVQPTSAGLGFGQLVALAAAVGFAANVFCTKLLSKTETTLTILFWMTVSQGLMSIAIDFGLSGPAGMTPMPTRSALPWIAVMGFGALAAHFSLTSAFRHAEASVVAPMDFVRLPVIAVIGMLLYNEAIDPLVVIGGAVIFFGNFLNIRAARARPATTPPLGG